MQRSNEILDSAAGALCVYQDDPSANQSLLGDLTHRSRHVIEEYDFVFDIYIRRDSSVLLSFRGTTNVLNWIQNIQFQLVAMELGDGTSVVVHSGFHDIFLRCNEIVAGILNEDNVKVSLVTGHSLGAAVATLVAFNLKVNMNRNVHLVTFASPRVGGADFVNRLTAANLSHSRIVLTGDPVPALPLEAHGYRHHGELSHPSDVATILPVDLLFDPQVPAAALRLHEMQRYFDMLNPQRYFDRVRIVLGNEGVRTVLDSLFNLLEAGTGQQKLMASQLLVEVPTGWTTNILAGPAVTLVAGLAYFIARRYQRGALELERTTQSIRKNIEDRLTEFEHRIEGFLRTQALTQTRVAVQSALTSFEIFATGLRAGNREAFVQLVDRFVEAGTSIQGTYQNYDTPIQLTLLRDLVDIHLCLLELWFMRACEEDVEIERKMNGATLLRSHLSRLEEHLSALGRQILQPAQSLVQFNQVKRSCFEVLGLQTSVRHMKLQLELGLQEITIQPDQEPGDEANVIFDQSYFRDVIELPSTEKFDRLVWLVNCTEAMEPLPKEYQLELLHDWHPTHQFHPCNERVNEETVKACLTQVERTINCRTGTPWCFHQNEGGENDDRCPESVCVSQALEVLGFSQEQIKENISPVSRAEFTELLEGATAEASKAYSTCARSFHMPEEITYLGGGANRPNGNFIVFNRMTEEPCTCHTYDDFVKFATPKVRVFHDSPNGFTCSDGFTLVNEEFGILSIVPPNCTTRDRIGYISMFEGQRVHLAFAGLGWRGISTNYICSHYSILLNSLSQN